MRWFFVTGTDTGIGKTTVTTALLKLASQAGLNNIGIKPLSAGCQWSGEQWVNDDALQLLEASSHKASYATINPIALQSAIAPHIAAHKEGIEITLDTLVKHCLDVRKLPLDLMLVEGAGGWLVPINQQYTLADLCIALEIPVILVVGMKLGCLNHALLTQQAIHLSGLRLAGWVANRVDADMEAFDANLDTLSYQLRAPCLGCIPYSPAGPTASAMKHLNLNYLPHAPI